MWSNLSMAAAPTYVTAAPCVRRTQEEPGCPHRLAHADVDGLPHAAAWGQVGVSGLLAAAAAAAAGRGSQARRAAWQQVGEGGLCVNAGGADSKTHVCRTWRVQAAEPLLGQGVVKRPTLARPSSARGFVNPDQAAQNHHRRDPGTAEAHMEEVDIICAPPPPDSARAGRECRRSGTL